MLKKALASFRIIASRLLCSHLFIIISNYTDVMKSSRDSSFNVVMQNFAFNPASLSVKVGTKVTWTNSDSAPHTVVSDPNGNMFNSQTLQEGDSFSFTFDKVGSFPYHCSIHPDMRGTIVVAE